MKDLFHNISTSTLGHLTDIGYLSNIQSQVPNQKMVGHIVTVKIYPPDASILREALITAQAGEVLAIECAVNDHYACWGELRNLAAQIKKLAGVIIAGNITDIKALRSQPFPVFAQGVSALTTRATSEPQNGEMNIPITLSGITINPGDIAIGDDDGLFVFSEDYAHSIHQAAQDKEQQDKAIKEALLSKFLSQINEIEPI
ncbi:4-hydroxy-4-methyl-2-oxoglutarate aldolase [Marinomonas spartinae]|uniref:Putative 4-hydroxy-4-methyl-2-oxoglutarate aldolase n=1 Tax=Marinomonas spartinae TaxID=1792290 RepID=A0A1A8TIM9_9GAMM|nr:RraA family protein [Marinomonas spartinae]SBS32013.1 4-hydroxy-4-methyl-2-oxoglutarate aldolase [Marinomonas spartinae]